MTRKGDPSGQSWGTFLRIFRGMKAPRYLIRDRDRVYGTDVEDCASWAFGTGRLRPGRRGRMAMRSG